MAQDADLLLRAGDLDGARAALVEAVKSAPADEKARMFLFQLMLVAGEWDKAKTQLSTLATLSPEAQMLMVAYGQSIAAEKVRADVFAGRAAMPILVDSPWLASLVEAIGHYARGDIAAGDAARDAAFDMVPEATGTLDGVAFEWIADADSRFGPAFEAIVGERYGLIPFDAVERITSEGPKDLRDIVWYPVQIAFRGGHSVAAMLPTRYPGSEASRDADERLARATGWNEAGWGSGQHLWSLSTGDDRDLLSVRSLTFG